jgi:hypothetical protein
MTKGVDNVEEEVRQALHVIVEQLLQPSALRRQGRPEQLKALSIDEDEASGGENGLPLAAPA